jgi:transcriptional regulator with XRE-family HTH domain
MLTGTQVRMARAALGWGVRELAETAKINPNTVSRIENGGDALASTLDRIQAALEDAGVIFIDRNEDGGPGVRLK